MHSIKKLVDRLMQMPPPKKAGLILVVTIVCLVFSVLGQLGYPLYFPFEGSLFLSLVCIIFPLFASLFLYHGKLAQVVLASSLIASFCALNIVVDTRVTMYVQAKQCQRMPGGHLYVEDGAGQCLYRDGVSEGGINSMGGTQTYSFVLVLPFIGTVFVGLFNIPRMFMAVIVRKLGNNKIVH